MEGGRRYAGWGKNRIKEEGIFFLYQDSKEEKLMNVWNFKLKNQGLFYYKI